MLNSLCLSDAIIHKPIGKAQSILRTADWERSKIKNQKAKIKSENTTENLELGT